MEQKSINKDKYAKLVRNIDINQLNLVELYSKKYVTALYNNENLTKIKVDIKHRSGLKSVQDNSFITEFKTEIFSETEKGEKIFNIFVVYEIVYSLRENIDLNELKDEVEFFVFRNVPVNIWPYIRETVSSVTTKMGFQPLVLEPLKIF
ncbi:preprotein translocase subunit SecB [Caloranaerobacter azorensis DSM 13643]|uniref:Preprotein translocase subunit SecB n=1 Tax=Caloranaerobacter azorensis DSM 13643 TaxID=1121264 RepID=A0A1M5T0S3_9FIRM|nr:protein-export chaperone SecB [Caloranaerobacter azorensis]SHH44242.1 preprotein translocase subunit SecB [Caloranaerobacter azorensis DSM 13643]